jgi:hypothetical protein
MSNGAPKQAKNTAYKAMLLAVITSLIGTSFILILGKVLVTWLSPDPTLQKMMYEVLPLLGFGNIALSFGATCQAVLGSQGRHRLATFIKLLTTWIFVVPFAVIMVYGANFNLLGIAGSLLIGYSLRGGSNAFLIFSSDWTEQLEQLSRNTGDEPVQAADEEEPNEGGMTSIPLTASEIVAELKSTEVPATSSTKPDVTTKTTTTTTKSTKPDVAAAPIPKEESPEQLAPQEALPQQTQQQQEQLQQPQQQQHPPKSARMEEIDALMEERIRKYAAQLVAKQKAGIIPSSSTDMEEGSKINFVIDTTQFAGEDVSYVTSLGGIEDKWAAEESEEDDEDEDQESDTGTDSDLSSNRSPSTATSRANHKASGWGFFSF